MNKRYAIISPYYKEDRNLIQRCIDSVKNQSQNCDHFLIADGEPQSWIDHEPVRHLKLDRAHADYGNTPRGIGALIAIGEQYDGIGLLDADNWLEPDHVELCAQVSLDSESAGTQCDYVVAQRYFRRPDETVMPIVEEPNHVDTNCFFFLKKSFPAVPCWAMIPKELSSIGDRIFFTMLQRQSYKSHRADKPTVNYHCIWESFYRAAGERPPIGAKPNISIDKAKAWAESLNARDLDIACRLAGIDIKLLLRCWA